MRAKPGKGHRALAAIEQSGKLLRHYTLNVDGLADAVGLSTWHPVQQPEGGLLSRRACVCKCKVYCAVLAPSQVPAFAAVLYEVVRMGHPILRIQSIKSQSWLLQVL